MMPDRPGASTPKQVERAIIVDDVSKRFRLYHERNQSLKSTLSSRRRARYTDLQALDHVSLTIEKGTTFGLIGTNGSGKSTLLKCMARILRPESGEITVHGKVSALLELGAGFHPELSGRDNVYLNAAILGLSSKDVDRKFDEIVDFAGLEGRIDTPVKNYSSGMYVRLGFSVAINVDPDVLLIDEVLAVGDEQFQRRCNEKISDMRERGKTIVVVSHGLGALRNICDGMAWLDQGDLRMVGEANEVIDAYIGEVQPDRHDDEDEGPGMRWGSGEAAIRDVELLGPDGRKTGRLHTGDRATVRVHFDTSERITKPVFGLAIFTLDGILVTGPNTREAGVSVDAIAGPGTVELGIERLMLLPGTYDISVSLYDHAITHPYDFRHKVIRFVVDPGMPHETFGGVMSLDGRWKIAPGATTATATATAPTAIAQ